jgi:hypothetical protein
MIVVCAIDRPALGHHFRQVSQTQLKAKIPAHAQDDDVAVEVATLEQLFDDLELAHCPPHPVQHASVAERTAPFAPEPKGIPLAAR